jgi:hypothetical protein
MSRSSEADSGDSLGFVGAVRRVFEPLAEQYDLHEVSSDRHRVVYEGPAGALAVVQEPASYELDIAFWPREPEVDRAFGIADFIRVQDHDRAAQYRAFAASTPRAVRNGLEQLADAVNSYARPALVSDGTSLRRVDEARKSAVAEFSSDRAHARDEEAAADAVRRRDWTAVIRLYEEREGGLTDLERRRLDIARRRAGG